MDQSIYSEELTIARNELVFQEKEKEKRAKELIIINREFKKAEKKLRASEVKYRRLFESAQDGILILNSITGMIEDVNPFLEKKLGYSKTEFMGKQLWNIGFFKDIEENKSAFAELQKTGYIRYDDLPLKTKDGRVLSVEFVSNVYVAGGKQVIQCNIRDITERKKVHQELQDTSNRLLLATNSAKIGIFDWDIPINNLVWDENMYKIFGVSPDKFSGAFEAWSNTVHPDDIHNGLADVQAAIDGTKEFHTFFRILWPNKEVRYVEGHAIILRDSDGKAIRMIGVNRDITEQKEAEQKILITSRLYQLVSSINQLIVHTTSEEILFSEACHVATNIGKFEMAWIGIANESEKKIKLVASSGLTDSDVKRLSDLSYEVNGPIDKVLQGEKYHFLNDIQNKSGITWKKYAVEKEINSIVVLQIRRAGKVIGAFNLYAREINFFDTEEIRMLNEITDDISFALEVFEKEKQKINAIKRLELSEAILNEAQSIAHLGNWQLNFATGIVTWSDEACRIYGIPIAENIQTFDSWVSFLHPEDLDNVMKIISEAQKTLSDSDFEHRILLKDGTIKYVQSVSKFLFDPNGKPLGLNGIVQDITERKKTEKELLLSESKFRKLFEQAGVGVAQVQTSTGSFVKVNKKFADMLGYSIDELLLLTFKDITHPDDIKESLQNQNRLLRKKIDEFSIEKRYLRKNGTSVWAMLTASSMGEIDGGEDFQIAVVQDITERKIAEETLVQSEARLKEAQALAKVGNWETDLSTLKIIWSEETFRIFELNADNFQSSHPSFLEFVHPDDRAKVDAAFVNSFDKDSINLIEHRIVTPTGIEKTVEERWQIFRDTHGKPIRAVGTCQDITERKLTEENLMQSENRFRALIEKGSDLITLKSVDGKLFYLSPSIVNVLGYSIEELLRTPANNFIHPDDLPGLLAQIQIILETPGSSFFRQQRYLHKNGTWIWFEGTVTNMLHEPGINALVSNFRDISERIKAEENLKHSEEHLAEAQRLAKMGSWNFDLKSDRLTWSEELYHIFGTDKQTFEETHGSFIHLIDKEDKELALQASRHTQQTGEPFTIDYHITTPKGERRIIQEYGYGVKDENGIVTRLFGTAQDITERKQAEDKMNKIARQLNEVSSSIPGAVFQFMLKPDGNFSFPFLSKGMSVLSGLSLEEIYRDANAAFAKIHPDDLPVVMQSIQESAVHLTPWLQRFRMKQPNDNYKWIRGNSIPGKLSAGSILWNGTMIDISDVKLAEESLQESETNLRAIFDNTNTGYVLLDSHLSIISFNDRGNEIAKIAFGKEFLKGLNYMDLIPSNRQALFADYNNKVLQGNSISYEVPYPQGDGSVFWFEISSKPVKNNQDAIIGISFAITDITERKKADAEFRKSEERYRQIVETTHEGIWLIDENNKTVFVNKRFCEMFGYSFEEMIGKTNFDLLNEEGKILAKEKMEQRKMGNAEDFELFYISKSGKKIWTNVSASSLMDENEKYVGALAMLTDITERKKSEIIREKMIADIIQRNNNLEQFSYIVSHNLRAPVANIMGLTQLINVSDNENGEHKQMIGMLSTAVNNLDTVIKDLNYILQVKQEVTEKKETVILSELVGNIKISINNMIVKEHAEIKTDFSDVDSIFTLKSYLYSIFYNLITNSIKYRRLDITPEIEITSFKSKNTITLLFKDNGLGIDLTKNRDKIFGLYKRFHTHTDGKGMGLFMVKTQVETLGGKISVQSEVNKGTEFKIEFDEEKII